MSDSKPGYIHPKSVLRAVVYVGVFVLFAVWGFGW